MQTITYAGRRMSVTDAAARLITTMDATPDRTRPLVVAQAKSVQGATAQTHTAVHALFTRESREATCAQLRAQNEKNRAFWAAQGS